MNQEILNETKNRVHLNIENIDSYSDDASNLLINYEDLNRRNSSNYFNYSKNNS